MFVQTETEKERQRVLSLIEEYDAQAAEIISENKEVDDLLLAIDKFFYWNPYFDFRGEEALGECNWPENVWVKYSCTPTGTLATHSIKSYSVVQ
jgi:hypothetical protein